MMSWVFEPVNAVTVSAWSFILGLFGTAVTLLGLYLTYRQASDARKSAQEAQAAVNAFRFRSDRYDAYRDLSQANYALEMTRKHLANGSWDDAADSYEDARRSIIRVQTLARDLTLDVTRSLTRMCAHMNSFCNKVDAARANKGDYPDREKVLATIRRNYELIVTLQKSLRDGEVP